MVEQTRAHTHTHSTGSETKGKSTLNTTVPATLHWFKKFGHVPKTPMTELLARFGSDSSRVCRSIRLDQAQTTR